MCCWLACTEGDIVAYNRCELCMQVVVTPGRKGKVTTEEMSLVEVGPRVCLQPIKIFAGSFGGPVIYENPGYVSPNKVSDRPDRPLNIIKSVAFWPLKHAE